jgi:stage II sporulation protein D
MPYSRRLPTLALLALLAALAAAASASAADRLTIRGAGWGHGVGMSQYGALGFAQHGKTYREILGHYYSGTAIGTTDAEQTVRVLLSSGASPTFTGATRVGDRPVDPGKVYGAKRYGATQVDLLSPSGRKLARLDAPLRATGSVLTTGGVRYRGTLELQPGVLGGLDVINAVPLDTYIRGVVPRESPSSWPDEALRAQAVAARTYAITTSRGGTFDHYRDVRSQVYGGVDAEVASTDRAVRDTRGEVVTYGGEPVITFFFSTSGGRTENVENTSLGTEPKPWLKSVADPYDDASPYHRWGPIKLTLKQAGRKLGSLVKGSLRGIKVLKRGRSPRIVRAEIIGSKGRTVVNGATLRARFGLRDTWAYFTSAAAKETAPPKEEPAPDDQAASEGGGASPGARMTRRAAVAGLAGRIVPGVRGSLAIVERREGARWVPVTSATIGRGGRFRVALTETGLYRVRSRDAASPAVRIT